MGVERGCQLSEEPAGATPVQPKSSSPSIEGRWHPQSLVPERTPFPSCMCHVYPHQDCFPASASGPFFLPRAERTKNALNRSTRSGLSHPASSPHLWSPLLTRYHGLHPGGAATAAGGRHSVRGWGVQPWGLLQFHVHDSAAHPTLLLF